MNTRLAAWISALAFVFAAAFAAALPVRADAAKTLLDSRFDSGLDGWTSDAAECRPSGGSPLFCEARNEFDPGEGQPAGSLRSRFTTPVNVPGSWTSEHVWRSPQLRVPDWARRAAIGYDERFRVGGKPASVPAAESRAVLVDDATGEAVQLGESALGSEDGEFTRTRALIPAQALDPGGVYHLELQANIRAGQAQALSVSDLSFDSVRLIAWGAKKKGRGKGDGDGKGNGKGSGGGDGDGDGGGDDGGDGGSGDGDGDGDGDQQGDGGGGGDGDGAGDQGGTDGGGSGDGGDGGGGSGDGGDGSGGDGDGSGAGDGSGGDGGGSGAGDGGDGGDGGGGDGSGGDVGGGDGSGGDGDGGGDGSGGDGGDGSGGDGGDGDGSGGEGSSPGVEEEGPPASDAEIGNIREETQVSAPAGDREGGSQLPRNDCTIIGTSGDDRIVGTKRNDVICALGGNDTIRSGKGTDVIDTGDGNDLAKGGSQKDVLLGLAGNDRLVGGSGADQIGDGAGRDRVAGGSGNDRIVVRDGTRDRVNGGPGKRDRAKIDRGDRVRQVERVR